MGRIIPHIMENKKMFQTTNQKISLLDALSIISRDISIQWIGQGKIQPFFRRRFFPNPSAAQFVLRKRTSPSWPATVAPSWENSNVEAESLHHISMGIQYGILDIYVYLYIRSMGISMYVYISYIYIPRRSMCGIFTYKTGWCLG